MGCSSCPFHCARTSEVLLLELILLFFPEESCARGVTVLMFLVLEGREVLIIANHREVDVKKALEDKPKRMTTHFRVYCGNGLVNPAICDAYLNETPSGSVLKRSPLVGTP
jgi:hypothetical protein